MPRYRNETAKKSGLFSKTTLWLLVRLELVYTIAVAAIITPIGYGLYQLSLWGAGVNHIGSDNLLTYLLNPITLICLFLILLLLTFATLLNIFSTVICLFRDPNQGKPTVSSFFWYGLRRGFTAMVPRNWLMIPFALFLLPFAGILSVTGIISTIEIPGFIQDAINANLLLWILVAAAELVLSYFVVRLSFVFHEMILSGKSFQQAVAGSWKLTRYGGHGILLYLQTVLFSVILAAASYLAQGILCAIGCLCIWIFVSPELRYTAAVVMVLCVSFLFQLLSAGLLLPINYCFLSNRYRHAANRKNLEVPVLSVPKKGKPFRVGFLIFTLVFAGLVLAEGITGAFAAAQTGTAALLREPQVTAHRGSSTEHPENSIPAFQQAIEDKADWIELDVHQTSDGVVVVTHDSSLKRIAGVDKEVWEVTYAELETYDVGSWFSSEFAGLHVATLEEVLNLCKGKIKVNIELKPTGHEPTLEQDVIAIIRKCGFEQDCVLASLQEDSVRKVKELAPDLKTLYLLTVAMGDVSEYTFADGISVEETFINSDLVETAHEAGKEVLVWTINSRDNVASLVKDGVDNIITDDPVLIRDAIRCGELNPVAEAVLSALFPTATETANTANATSSELAP